MMLRPVSLGLGGLFLSLALIYFTSATIGRGNWLRPASRPVIWVLEKAAGFFWHWKEAISRFDESIESEIALAIGLLFKVLLMPLPCLGILVVILLLAFGWQLGQAPGLFLGLWGILDDFLRGKQLAGVLIVLIGSYVLYEIAIYLLKKSCQLIEWSAEVLSQGQAARRQGRSAAVLALLGIVGLGIGLRAPTLDEIAAVRLTPTVGPPRTPYPTSTPPFNLPGSDLSKISLAGETLDDTNLRGANLNGIDLSQASLLRVDLRNAKLVGANLEGANLDGADLRGADLTGATLESASFQDAILSTACLRLARLNWANLREVDLSNVDFRGASLQSAWLIGANLRGADLAGADLRYAHLSGADLTGARVELVQLLDSYLPGTTMPDGADYDGRFHTSHNDVELDYLLKSDGLDPSETLELEDYLRHYGVSREAWEAGQAWASEHLAELQAESDAWYAAHWPDD